MILTNPKPLDHLVLPTASLETARARLTRLGFTVAPRGVHPFGTENACVYFSDGTFLEPLAIADQQVVERAVASGNVFVIKDRAYRQRLGDDGFSAVVLATHDAEADHARYLHAGLSAGDRLDFSRPFIDASGASDTASFKLAFAADSRVPDAFLFACERVNAPKVDRSTLQAHANGVQSVAEVIAVSDTPSAHMRLLALASASQPDESGGGGTISLPNSALTVLDPTAFEARFGIPAGISSALRFAAVVFSVVDGDALNSLLAASAVGHHLCGSRIVIPPAPGQGAIFAFQEIA